MSYTLLHSNVDGAGVIATHETLESAKAQALELQRRSDESGNPWRYRYHVYCHGARVYSTGGAL